MIGFELIENLRSLFLKQSQAVSEIEMTLGNYDDDGNEIEGSIPTIITKLCEIDAYDNTCYFTIILKSELLTKAIFEDLMNFNNVHIYGLTNFKEDYYPKQDFDYSVFESQIKLEEYVQVQFNFNKLDAEHVFDEYQKIDNLFKRHHLRVVNQLEDWNRG